MTGERNHSWGQEAGRALSRYSEDTRKILVPRFTSTPSRVNVPEPTGHLSQVPRRSTTPKSNHRAYKRHSVQPGPGRKLAPHYDSIHVEGLFLPPPFSHGFHPPSLTHSLYPSTLLTRFTHDRRAVPLMWLGRGRAGPWQDTVSGGSFHGGWGESLAPLFYTRGSASFSLPLLSYEYVIQLLVPRFTSTPSRVVPETTGIPRRRTS